ncbi:MAG TPA: RcnB family protein [Allosphingosinicella sp.]|jgi:Ni/Co efflux regulator RcnB|nr:RcnB family protein [Allosphingosinicella sp.]
MRMLSLTLLAASIAVLPAAASAQPGPRGGGPRAGATWRGGGFTGPAVRGPNVQMRGPNMQGGNVRMHGGNMQMHGGGGNFSFHRWGPHPGRNFRYSRLRRGGSINSFWFAPQFYIGNWQAYGFAAPGDDQRWVRYYDDAYLIDGGGRVLDERYGVDWDNYGEDWGDEDGIPAYRGEWRDGGEDSGDYAEEEYREEHHGGRGGHGGPGYGPPPPGYGPPPPGYGRGATYGGYYGYGAYAYPIVIETVTTTGGGYSEEIVEEYVEVRQHHRVRRPRVRCQCAPPPRPVVRRPAPRRRPPAGERG